MVRFFQIFPSFWKDKKAAAALEFAIVVIPFLVIVYAIFEISMTAFATQQLDYAAQKAARTLQIGSTDSGSASSFRNAVVCPLLGSMVTCANVYIRVENATNNSFYNFQNTSAADIWCPGGPNDIIAVRLVYRMNNLFTFLNPAGTRSGPGYTDIPSGIVIRREPTAVPGTSC